MPARGSTIHEHRKSNEETHDETDVTYTGHAPVTPRAARIGLPPALAIFALPAQRAADRAEARPRRRARLAVPGERPTSSPSAPTPSSAARPRSSCSARASSAATRNCCRSSSSARSISRCPSTVMSSEVDLFGVFEMPYLVKDREHMKRIEKEVVWPTLAPAAEKKGLKIARGVGERLPPHHQQQAPDQHARRPRAASSCARPRASGA